jgi:hypothetical protein
VKDIQDQDVIVLHAVKNLKAKTSHASQNFIGGAADPRKTWRSG